jgi:endo-1,4-beta-xylanase
MEIRMNQRQFSRRNFLKQSVGALAVAAGLSGSARAAGRAPALRDLADQIGFYIGPAIANSPLINEPIYRDTAAREFNFLTPETAMKWAATHPQPNTYTFGQADTIFNFAANNNMAVHGHNLIWQIYNPDWLSSGNYSRDQMIAIMADHIYTVAGRYSGGILAWDVVNEALDNNGNLASGIWRDRLGTDYLDLAFLFARDADPNALLVYNDWGTETVNNKSTGMYNMIRSMLDRGIPIDGVGFQMHITTDGINYDSFAQNLQRFADLGLILFVTEMDVRMQLPVTSDKLATQANVYRNGIDVCLNQPAVAGFQMWGFTDRHSWIPGSFPGWGAALIFDSDYNPKPAYDAILMELGG